MRFSPMRSVHWCAAPSVLTIVRRVRKIAKGGYSLRHVCPSVRPSLRPSTWNSAPTGRIFIKFDISIFLENLRKKTGSLHEILWTFMIISRWILRKMRNFVDKSCRENQNTHFMLSNFFFRKLCHLWDNVEKCGRTRQATDDNIIRCMRILCWIPKATHTH